MLAVPLSSGGVVLRSWPDDKIPRQQRATLSTCPSNLNGYDPARLENLSVPMPALAPEIVDTDLTRVACDGGGGALGHPKVYLEMGDENFVECPYCDKRFVLKPGAGHH
jgi:uncharacterized Zn-finger protein